MNQAITNAEIEKITQESKLMTGKPDHEALAKQRLLYQEREATMERKYDEAIQGNIALEGELITTKDTLKSLAVQVKTLQNRLTANVTNLVVDESRMEDTDVSRIVANTMVRSIEKLAQEAKEEHKGRKVF